MRSIITAILFLVALAGPVAGAGEAPKVDVVFVLDTTGSMGGLIEGAKLKIWSIANQIVAGEPTPDLRVGLVGYRDVGDDFVTRAYDLSTDLDQVYADLMSFQAGGGGDTPEHVSRALHDAVEDMAWDNGRRTLRILFLVGDAPPHVDYNDGFDYKSICETAVRNDIIINTIQCGGMAETVEYWREIARLGEGEYALIPQAGGMRSIPTPVDAEISRLSAELDATVVAFGGEDKMERMRETEEMVAAMSPSAVADRAACKSASGRMGAYDLIDALQSGSVQLEDVAENHLPEEMRGMNLEEKRAFLAQKKKQRVEITSRIRELNEERDAYIKEKLSEGGREDSFDARVLSMIRSQAGEKGISY